MRKIPTIFARDPGERKGWWLGVVDSYLECAASDCYPPLTPDRVGALLEHLDDLGDDDDIGYMDVQTELIAGLLAYWRASKIGEMQGELTCTVEHVEEGP